MVLKIFEVVPESCQRTDGIKAWLETKEEREERQFRKDKILFAKNSFLFCSVHILRQPKSGVPGPPLPPRQILSAFARRPFCTTIFYEDLFT